MSTLTPFLSLVKPTVGGDANTWGTSLNQNFDTLDTLLKNVPPTTTSIAVAANANISGANSGLYFISGNNGSVTFLDLVLFITGFSTSTINFLNQGGATTRTYSNNAGLLNLALSGGSGTYSVISKQIG